MSYNQHRIHSPKAHRVQTHFPDSVPPYYEAMEALLPEDDYKWQRGQAMPTLDNIVILAAVLGVGIDDIIVCSDPFQAKITA